MRLSPDAHIHLIAACGTAMGSLAGMLRERGYRVTGSDASIYPPMSTMLEGLGIGLHEGFAAKNLQPAPDLVIVGNAVSRGNPEVEAALEDLRAEEARTREAELSRQKELAAATARDQARRDADESANRRIAECVVTLVGTRPLVPSKAMTLLVQCCVANV